MSIQKINNVFKLDTKNSSYIISVTKEGYLKHLYYGAFIKDTLLEYLVPNKKRAYSVNIPENTYSLDIIPQEYSGGGCSDFRLSSIAVRDNTGYNSIDLKYKSYNIIKEKPELKGLPSAYDFDNDSETLQIILEDSVRGVEVKLLYTIFERGGFLTRSAVILNTSEDDLFVEKAMSLCLDMSVQNLDMITLNGTWANERNEQRREISHGIQGVYSRRGTSSHQHNPFCVICDCDANENSGNAYAFGLVYSGNHIIEAEKNQFEETRLVMGINPEDFEWKLAKNEEFYTPEVLMACSNEGINALSQIYHHAVRNNICRGVWKNKRRPVLINNWEATYFDFDEDKILALAKQSKELGIEMIVLDDGWFGKRNDDTTSLGDWFTDYQKLPNGLDGLCKKINDLDMKFGLWIEPEMISEDSELYRKHSDWVLSQEGRTRSVGRTQYILDFTRQEVIDGIWEQLDAILKVVPISYIKWDMNRNLTEVGSLCLSGDAKKQAYHRQMLGVYQLMGRLVNSYPDILLENCAGGGGRFDLGMLCYSPQIWTSDDTDAVQRVSVQYGTSFAYPVSCMGAHVSAVPNHQTGRVSSIELRGNVALFGAFGYELDLTEICDEEKEIIKKQCEFYKENALLIQNGKFYRIQSPQNSNYSAWQVVSEDEKHIFVLYVTIKGGVNQPLKILKLPHANQDYQYKDIESGEVYFGDTLCNAGLIIHDVEKDYSSKLIHFVAIN